MGSSKGVGGLVSQQVQQIQILAPSPESASPKVGHLGSHTVKVVSPSTGEKANLVQSKDQLAASLGGRESAVDSFLQKTEVLRDYINTRMAEQGRSGGSLSLKSELSAKINSRAGEWIDSISALMDAGTSAEEVDRASEDLVGELIDLVDRSFAESPKAASAAKPEVASAEKPEVASAEKPAVASAEPKGVSAEKAKVASAEPKNVAAEKLAEADSKYSSRAAKALNAPAEKTHVYKNLGGGSCFFHSILQLLAKSDPSRYPTGNESKAALNLRKSLIRHVHHVKNNVLKDEEMHGMETSVENGKVTYVSARVRNADGSEDMKPIIDGFNLAFDREFEKYETFADVSTAALMADYLQRPVVVVVEDRKGVVGVQEFKYGLESGQELKGEPLTIYYDEGRQHFMAVSVDA